MVCVSTVIEVINWTITLVYKIFQYIFKLRLFPFKTNMLMILTNKNWLIDWIFKKAMGFVYCILKGNVDRRIGCYCSLVTQSLHNLSQISIRDKYVAYWEGWEYTRIFTCEGVREEQDQHIETYKFSFLHQPSGHM